MNVRRRIFIAVWVCWLSFVAGSPRAQTPLEQRAEDVAALFRSDPGGYEALFSEGFLAQIPPVQLTNIFTYYHTTYGAVVEWRMDVLERPGTGAFTFITDRGYGIASKLTVNADPPHLLDGLWFDNGVRLAASFDAVIAELDSLPGTVSFLLSRLDEDAATPLASLNPDQPLAIGSAFKLYILAALVQDIEDGERAWTDVVALEAEAVSLPSGRLQAWPVGAPLTLHTLATQMISESDNTATDQLLRLLGRTTVEAMLAQTGHADPTRNQPFLSTLDMFRLKGDPSGAAAPAYLAATEDERRALLDGLAIDHDSLRLYEDGQPAYIDTIEWFASARDLSRVMTWLRNHTETEAGRLARGLLAVNPGVRVSKTDWPYVGYKGGSEPGVLNLTYLMRDADGVWYTLAASWNNPDAPVETGTLLGLAQRAFQLVAED